MASSASLIALLGRVRFRARRHSKAQLPDRHPARVVVELQGISCLPLPLIAARKGLAVTRTFGEYVTEWQELAQAVSTFATRAGEKLREHGLLACAMAVFIQTKRFVPGEF